MVTTMNRWNQRIVDKGAQLWRAVQYRNRRIEDWFIQQGVPNGIAYTFLWIIEAGVLLVILYMAFWIILLIALLVSFVWLVRNYDFDDREKAPEWREGISGYGLYRGNVRIDPYISDDE